MVRFLRQLLAVVVGFVAGSVTNMGLILLGGRLIPPPAGTDVSTMEGLAAALPAFEPKHFLFPFLAHALGTLVGAVAAGLLAVGRSIVPAWVIGALFLCAGIANIAMLPGPLWFNTVDVLFAYLPMAWLAQTLVNRLRPPAAA